MPEFTGSCLCKAVQFELAAAPQQNVVCHCDTCQKKTGSAFAANSFFKTEDLTITHGQDHIKTYDESKTWTGNTMKNSFCDLCGSHLYLSNDWLADAGLVAVTSGSIDQRDKLQPPTTEYFCRTRRKWLSGFEGATQLETQSK